MHALLEVHDTAESHADQPEAVGIGVLTIDHLEPFQCSTSGIGSRLVARSQEPTAVQSRVDTHDTPRRSVSSACTGRGAE